MSAVPEEIITRLQPSPPPVGVAVTFFLLYSLPSFWVADMGDMKLTLGLSGWTTNDWTRGSALDLLAQRLSDSRAEPRLHGGVDGGSDFDGFGEGGKFAGRAELVASTAAGKHQEQASE